MLIDQHIQTADAVYVDFFNRPAATTSALAALALRTGAPVDAGVRAAAAGRPLPDGLRARRSSRRAPTTPTRSASSRSAAPTCSRCTCGAIPSCGCGCTAAGATWSRPATRRAGCFRRRPDDGDASDGRASSVCSCCAPNWLGDAVMALPAMAACAARSEARTLVRRRASRRSRRCFEERTAAAPDDDRSRSIARAKATQLRGGAVRRRRCCCPNSFGSAWLREPARHRRALGLRGRRTRLAADARRRRPARPRAPGASTTSTCVRGLGIDGPAARARRGSCRGRRRSTQRRRAAGAARRGDRRRRSSASRRARPTDTPSSWPPDRVAQRDRRRWRASAARAACWSAPAPTATTARAIESALPRGRARVVDLDRPHRRCALLVGVLARCAAFVSNDSGAMHLAAALGVPVDGDLRPDRRAGDAPPAGPTRDVIVRRRVLPALHAARVPDRSPLHDAALTPTRVLARRDQSPRRRPGMRRGRLSRSRRHAHRGRRLPRSPRAARALSVQRRRDPPAESRRLRDRGRHQPGRHRAAASSTSVRRRGAPRTSPSALAARRRAHRRASTTARTIPTRRRRAYRQRLRLPQAEAGHAAARPRRISTSISRARSWSATSGTTWRRGRRSARAACWCAPGSAARTKRRREPGTTPAAIVDNLMDAAAWILQQP